MQNGLAFTTSSVLSRLRQKRGERKAAALERSKQRQVDKDYFHAKKLLNVEYEVGDRILFARYVMQPSASLRCFVAGDCLVDEKQRDRTRLTCSWAGLRAVSSPAAETASCKRVTAHNGWRAGRHANRQPYSPQGLCSVSFAKDPGS